MLKLNERKKTSESDGERKCINRMEKEKIRKGKMHSSRHFGKINYYHCQTSIFVSFLCSHFFSNFFFASSNNPPAVCGSWSVCFPFHSLFNGVEIHSVQRKCIDLIFIDKNCIALRKIIRKCIYLFCVEMNESNADTHTHTCRGSTTDK